MKKVLLLTGLMISLTLVTLAQQIDSSQHKKVNPEDNGIPIENVISHIGSEVYVRDFVKGDKIINDSLRLIFLGGKFPKQVLTIVIKGKKLNKQTKHFWKKNDMGYFTGIAMLYEGKPAIIITSQWQLGKSILI